jgi:DNA-binding NarL/FixJ family response regulator
VRETARPLGAPTGHTAARGRPVGVLVIDDSLVFRTGMCRAVEAHEGLELLGQADGGEAGLDAIAELEPDVVILDLRMPDLSGISVLHRLHAQDPPPTCRVLVISATVEDGIGDEVLSAGADGCLSKALSRAEICDAVMRLGSQSVGS